MWSGSGKRPLLQLVVWLCVAVCGCALLRAAVCCCAACWAAPRWTVPRVVVLAMCQQPVPDATPLCSQHSRIRLLCTPIAVTLVHALSLFRHAQPQRLALGHAHHHPKSHPLATRCRSTSNDDVPTIYTQRLLPKQLSGLQLPRLHSSHCA